MELPVFNDNLRSSAAWSVALGREREEWQRAQATPETHNRLRARVRTQQVLQALRRAGHRVGEGQIARLVIDPPDEATLAGGAADEPAAAKLLRAAQLVSDWAAEAEAALTADRLTSLYRTLAGAAGEGSLFRQSEAQLLSPAHNPPPAVILPRLVESAFDWFGTPSFAEMHVVEQAALVYLRLLDLQPFPADNEQAALLAASFYTERAGLPPLIIFSDDPTAVRYTAAVEAALRMLTQPLVEFFAESLARTIKKVMSDE